VLVNPRPPSVPATLSITLDEYFATASLIGLLSASKREPNKQWAKDWSYEMGDADGRRVRASTKKQR
jgi:hypothetical protein